jgi:hypothetical protein
MNLLKRALLTLAVFVVVATTSMAVSPTYEVAPKATGGMFALDLASGVWRAVTTNASGAMEVSLSALGSGAYTVSTLSVTLEGPTGFATDPAYFKDAKSTVSAPTRYATNLSTSTPTLLSAIASWTLPCSLQIQCNNVCFYDAATTTAATVWAGQRMAQYDTVWISPSSVSFNMSFIASSSANASLSVLVWPTSY